MKKTKYKGGILNPFTGREAKFQYAVLDLDKVENKNYFDGEEEQVYPERQILIGALTGDNTWSQKKYLCTVGGEDALKNLREGDIITAELSFDVKKDDDGKYYQTIHASDIFTLDDYHQICKAESFYKGSLTKR